MENIHVGSICIETDDAFLKIGPFVFEDNLTDKYIRSVIHDVLSREGNDYYDVSEVNDIVVIFASEDYDGMYSPKIEDVWPLDFGRNNKFQKFAKKGGDKKAHGKNNVRTHRSADNL